VVGARSRISLGRTTMTDSWTKEFVIGIFFAINEKQQSSSAFTLNDDGELNKNHSNGHVIVGREGQGRGGCPLGQRSVLRPAAMSPSILFNGP